MLFQQFAVEMSTICLRVLIAVIVNKLRSTVYASIAPRRHSVIYYTISKNIFINKRLVYFAMKN